MRKAGGHPGSSPGRPFPDHVLSRVACAVAAGDGIGATTDHPRCVGRQEDDHRRHVGRVDPRHAERRFGEHRLTGEAALAAEDIIDDARTEEREIRLGAEDYADEILSTLETNLGRFLSAVQRGREQLQQRTSDRTQAGDPVER